MKITSLISPKFKAFTQDDKSNSSYSTPFKKTTADVFVKSSNQATNPDIYSSKNEKVKSPNTANSFDDISIVKDLKNFDKFYLMKNNEILCWMQMSDNGECIQIDKLYSNNPESHVGAGTELLRYAVQKSIEQGYGGKVNICMAGSQPFYRKCNFKLGKMPADYDPALDAIFDFSARSKGEYSMGWSKRQTMFAFLDEAGAQAFLQNKRIFLKPDSKVMGEVTLNLNENDKNAKISGIVDFCDVGDNKYVVQFLKVDKTENTVYQSAYILAELVETGDTPAFKVIETKTFGVPFSCRNYEDEFNTEVYNELMFALETRAEELGFEVLD